MKIFMIIIVSLVVLFELYFWIGYGYCNFGSTTMEIKNYTGVCKVIKSWY